MDVAKESIDLGLMVRNVEECRKFYGETLGLPFQGEMSMGPNATMYRYLIGSTVLKLNTAAQDMPVGPAGLRAQTGIRYFTISVPDIEATIAKIRGQGVEPIVPVREIRPGVRIAMVADPDGNTVEFLENRA
jgi:catechol 2,3-dioxygenase-like lactoylglutathione lyase family enzyme